MPRVFFRAFRTRGYYANFKVFREEIAKEHRRRVGPDLRALHKEQTAHWKVPPEYRVTHKTTSKGITTNIVVSGPSAGIWNILRVGVKKRVIRPRVGRRLGRKLRGQRPPALRFSVGGRTVNRAVVYNWPGIRAFRYSQQVAAQYNDTYRRLMENAVRRGARAAVRRGS